MIANFRIRYLKICLCALLYHYHGAVASTLMSPPAFHSPASVSSSLHDATSSPHLTFRNRHHHHHIRLKKVSALSATPDGKEKTPSARDRGIYSRPSAAIERGSGFFIPGLEGSRIRFIFGITVLVADAANHVLVGGRSGDWGQTVAELISAFYGALLLLQGSIELGVERGIGPVGDGEGIISMEEGEAGAMPTMGGGSSSRGIAEALQGNEEIAKTIQRMAKTIITFTPATYFRLVDENLGVLFSLGTGNDDDTLDIDANEQNRLIKISLDALSESRGGRVALPSDHPASKLLPEAATRCILVQKVNGFEGSSSRGCMIIGSDKLLPSFTKNDLRWIGQLADYNNMLGGK